MSLVADMGRYDEIVAFARVLHECGQVSDIDDVLRYLEKPWKWQKEFSRWQELGGRLTKETLDTMSNEWAEGKL